MPKTKMTSFEAEDVLHLVISEESEEGTGELSPNITAELNGAEVIGIEILHASTYLRDSILDSAYAKMLRLPQSGTT